jgi:SpoVK/Ycf46/Vps4 family AAA+-type ATPase
MGGIRFRELTGDPISTAKRRLGEGMTKGHQRKATPRERRIIERPRLFKVLEDTEARTILLVAPAGYGKTTLARQ